MCVCVSATCWLEGNDSPDPLAWTKLVAAQTALATATSVPVKGKGKGGAGGKGKSTKMEDRLRAVESVIVQHERTIHMLEDRCSMVILVREAIHQQKIQEFRDLHLRQGEEIKKKDHVALDAAAQKAGHPSPGRTAHPLGSQRSLLLTFVFNEINAVTPAGTEGSVAVKEMLKLQTAQLDEFFVRLKAKHDRPRERPREGRPWVWSLTLAEVVPAELRAALQAIARWSKENRAGLAKGIQIAPQHSQDGNIVKNILKGPQKQEDDWEMDGDGENDDGSRNGQKRGRR